MHKKHIFLRVFSKITIFACVFCAFSAWADTTCNTNFTPIMGNSIQNGTPTPTNPVEVISVGNKTTNLANYNKPIYEEKIKPDIFPDDKVLPGFNYSNLYGSSTNQNVIVGEGTVSFDTKQSEYGVATRITLKSNTQYTINFNATNGERAIVAYNNNGSWSHSGYLKLGRAFTTPSEFQIAVLIIMANTGATETNWIHASMTDIMLVEGSVAPTSYVPYGYRIPGTSIYLDEPLRKVGNYADELRPDDTVIRRVGVKVLDGTEDWEKRATVYPHVLDLLPTNYATGTLLVSNYYSGNTANSGSADYGNYSCWVQSTSQYPRLYIRDDRFTTLSGTTGINDFKAYLAQQYANGTPVTVYYPLATEVVENWSCGPIAEIKIATTKMVDEEFAAAEANLAATVQTIESVVSRTIAQTGQIQVLQDTKQTRPDESCPANMKCLLVQDEDGTPHWYPIIEP